jgi:hypothetical protein
MLFAAANYDIDELATEEFRAIRGSVT